MAEGDDGEGTEEKGFFGRLMNWFGGLFGGSASDQYSKTMAEKMGSSIAYYHEDGINYARVTPRVIVGSCLQTAADVDTIRDKEGVATVLCLQEDKDMAWWNLDINPIIARSQELATIKHVREPIRDFDPFSLRERLPEVVRRLCLEMDAHDGAAYIHCTAGLGRAPGVALAYMWWVEKYSLVEAYEKLYSVRPCHPQLKSIRSAACDILDGGMSQKPVLVAFQLDEVPADTAKVELSGLNVGWGARLELTLNAAKKQYELATTLPQTGKFLFKFILTDEEGEETWVTSKHLATVDDNGNENNVIEMVPEPDPRADARTERLMSEDGDLTPEERTAILDYLYAGMVAAGAGVK